MEAPPQVINCIDEMRQFKKQNQALSGISAVQRKDAGLLHTQIRDLNKY